MPHKPVRSEWEANAAEDPLREAVHRRCDDLLRLAASHYGVELPTVTVTLDLRGSGAGLAYPREFRVRFHPVLLHENPALFLDEVVAHEIAHLVAYRVFGQSVRPHGPEWASVMALYGVDARRCHGFNVEKLDVRKQRRHAYRCSCKEHALSTTRHNRISKGKQQYLCRQCGGPLVAVGNQP